MQDDTTRRRFLTAAATGSVALVAGCSGDGDGDGEPSGEQSGDGTDPSGGNEDDAGGGASGNADDETDSGSTEDADRGTLRLSITGNVQSLDPIIKGSGGINQWGETLVGYDNGLLPPQPELATGYEVSDDGLTYRFTLQEGVTFHDGQELTAKDVVYSWERIAGSEHSENADDVIGGTFIIEHEKDGDSLSDYVPGTLAVSAPEKYVFEVELREPFHAALPQIASETAFSVIPEGFVGDIEREGVDTDGEYAYNEAFGTEGDGPQVVATGPFQVEDWSKGDRLVLSAFDEYHGSGPHVDQIEYTILPDDGVEYDRAQNGNLDVFSVPRADLEPDNIAIEEELPGGRRVGTYTLPNGREVNYGEVTDLRTEYILFNCQRTIEPARRAIAWIVNQHALAEDIYKGLARPAYEITPPPVFPTTPADGDVSAQEAYDRHAREGFMSQTSWGADGYPYGYDESNIERAREVMAEAGYSEDDPYETTFTIFSDDSTWDQIAQRIQSRARAAHMDIEIQTATYNTIINEGGLNHNMDFFSLGDTLEWPEGDNFLRFLHPESASGESGFTQWGERDGDQWATEPMRTAHEAWNQKYAEHRGQGEENQRMRDEAYLTIEEVNWHSMQELPLVNTEIRSYWSTDVEYEMPGVMEGKTYNEVRLNRDA